MNNWLFINLDEVVLSQKGTKPAILKNEPFADSVPYLDIKTLESGIISKYADSKTSKLVTGGDLLVVWDGSRSGLTIRGKEGAIGSTLMKLSPLIIDRDYLFYFLKSQYDFINKSITGVSIPHVNPKIFWELKFPLATLEEQALIAKRLDAIFQLISNSINKLTDLTLLTNRISRKIIEEACSGNLSDEYISGNSNYDILNLISIDRDKFDNLKSKAAKRNGIKTRPLRTNSLPIEESLPDVPNHWKWTRLVNIAEIQGGVAKGKKHKKTDDLEDMPYLRVANVQDGYLDLSEIKSIAIKRQEREKYLLKTGDILFTEGGDRDKLGRSTIWRNNIKNCIYQNHVFRARLYSKHVLPEFINLFVKSEFAKAYFFSNAKQTTNLASINITALGNLPVPIPPTEEQHQIIKNASQLVAKLNKLIDQRGSVTRFLNDLESIILKKAFKGELLTSEKTLEGSPNQLYERIKEEKFKRQNSEKIARKKSATSTKSLGQFEFKFYDMNLIDILKSNRGKMSAKELWQASEHKGSIDSFYAELKIEVEVNKTIKESKDKKYLEIANEN